MEDGTMAHIRTSGHRRPQKCVYCGKVSEFLCDYPVGKTRSGKKKDCDKPLCSNCTQKGVSADVDFCREHFPLAKAAYDRRLERDDGNLREFSIDSETVAANLVGDLRNVSKQKTTL